jgi:hypothetical protein
MYFYFSETFHRKILPCMANQEYQSKGKSSIVIPDRLLACFSQIRNTIAELVFCELKSYQLK